MTSQANTDRVYIFDTTLRDGEQSPGATMTLEEKLQIADILDPPISTGPGRRCGLPSAGAFIPLSPRRPSIWLIR